MATWTISKKLNVSPYAAPLVIQIKQYTSDFALKLQLYSTVGDLDIPAGATTKIRGTKRDGNGFELTGTRIGNTCTFSGTKAQMQQMTAAHGRCVFEIVVENNTRELITANFYLDVQRAAMDAGTVTSESIIEEFADFQSKITAAQAAATAAQAQADRAEAAAESIDFGLDSVPTQGSTNAVSSGGVYSALIDTKNGLPEIRTPDETDADLYLSDANGNVLMELADGHIRTKNFDSSDIDTETDTTLTEEGKPADAKAVGDAISAVEDDIQAVEESIPDVSGFASIKSPEEVEADLYIGDSYGNVLAKLASGAIETKNFKGFQYITYKSASVTYSTLPLTLTVNHKFKKGDKVVLHVDRGAMPWDYGAYVNYYEDDRLVFSGKRIDCAWIEHVITEDTDAIIATYTGQPSTAGMTVGDVYTLEVSLLGDIPIKPTVVTVKKDGTGDYTTLRGALDAIGTKANDVLNPYRIEIYAGTYDVMDDYTDAEISAAVYDQTSFVGPKLLNGMYLVGIGAPNEVVLNGDLDTTQFSSTIRGDISTLNCQGSCGFENLTVIANHLRYCVHDDFHTTIGKKPKRIVKDCIFRGYDISYNPGTTYGAGTSDSGCDYEFENCDFGENAGVHTLSTIAQKSFIHLVNCKGHGFRIGDQETSDPVDGYSIYQFDNCDFLWINHNMSDDVPHVIVRGSGNGSPIYQFPAATLYDTGDVVAMRNGGFSQTCNVGEVTEWFSNAGHGPRFRKATSVNGASGIVVYKDANDTYIQTKGYVCTDRTTLTTFALGDYIGIANSLPVVVSDASDAIGRIAYIDNSGNGYIKLNFGG